MNKLNLPPSDEPLSKVFLTFYLFFQTLRVSALEFLAALSAQQHQQQTTFWPKDFKNKYIENFENLFIRCILPSISDTLWLMPPDL